MDFSHLPWYAKVFLSLGGLTFVWKLVQGGVPKILAYLTPLAIRGADAGVALILSQPLARWFILGNLANSHATINALMDGLEQLIDTVQKRINDDLDAAAAPAPEQPAGEPGAKPPAA